MLPDNTSDLFVVRFLRTYDGESTLVRAHTPDSLKFSFGAKYSAPFQRTPTRAEAAIGMSALGVEQEFSALLWGGMTERSNFQLNLIFNAEQDARMDVVQPVQDLIGMILPEHRGAIVILPGPTVAGKLTDKIKEAFGGTATGDNISFLYGNSFFIDPIVITGLQIEMPTIFDVFGNPLQMKATVQFQPFYTPFKNNFTDGDSPLLYTF